MLSDVGKGIAHGVEAVGDAIGDAGKAVVHGLEEGAKDVADYFKLHMFGGKVGGVDPYEIWEYFHGGPGTQSYAAAQHVYGKAGNSYGGISQDINKAKQQLASGWHGEAADRARAAMGRVQNNFDEVGKFSGKASGQIGDQVGSFNDAKGKVQKVPQNPPPGGGIASMTPAGMITGIPADINAAQYQDQAKANQHAYQGYGGATSPQGAALPNNQIQALPPGSDPSVDHQRTSGGQTSTYNFSGGSGGVILGSGPSSSGRNRSAPPVGAPGGTSAQSVEAPPSNGPVNVPPPSNGPVPGPGRGPLAPGPIGGADPRLPGGGGESFSPSPGGTGGARGGGVPPFAPVTDGAGGRGGSTLRGTPKPGTFRGGSLKEPESGSGSGGKGSGTTERTQPGGRTAAKALGAEPEGTAVGKGAGAAGKGGSSGAVPPGGRGGKKKDDEEHETPSYLIHEEHGNQIVGDLDPTAPPVIGDTATDQ
ncbi:WXG100 family type VII secretion target [Sciscionella sediminilitoris]|uniref:WXG100 family type VII secretion target n=1 Tax=Sciscionella sediminilitoris TaxID=1445613 RepID=UPI0012E1AA07|nr:WXG100 family type VII secretion target [Sciscionella sp. SE31]